MSVASRRELYESTASDVQRGQYGQVIWPENTRAAFYQLCDLARVAPDTFLTPEKMKARLWEHGEATKLRIVAKIMDAMDRGQRTWR